MGAPRGLGRPNCSPFLLPTEPSLPGQTVATLFDTLFVVLDALLVAYFRCSFFNDIFISQESLWGSILSSQTDPPTLEIVNFTVGSLHFLKINVFDPKMVLRAFGGSLGLLLGALGGILGAAWGL